MDFIACEPQFVDHAAALYAAMPDRGRFLAPVELIERARRHGIDADAIDIRALKSAMPIPPKAKRADGPLAFVVSIGDMKIARRLGYRRFVFMEHGAGQAYIGERSLAGRRHHSYAGGMDREDVELFLCPNEYSARLWRAAYPDARVEVVGAPRLDRLPARQIDPVAPSPTVAISFHWPSFVSQEANTAVGHYRSALGPLAQAFNVIGHAHPKGDWQGRMERIYRKVGIPFVADFDDVCRQADVYVCDNSSTLFEFAATGRPVVVLNSPMYRRNVHHGLRFWDAADVGVQVDEPADLISGVERALEDPPVLRANREAALGIVYAYRSGATTRAVGVISDFLGAAAVAA